MRNFIFPQLFQPIIGENDFAQLGQWHLTTKRIQTEVEMNVQKSKTHRTLKTSRHQFLLQPTNISQKLSASDSVSIIQKPQIQENIRKVRFETDISQIYKDEVINKQQYKYQSNQIKVSTNSSKSFRINKQRSLNFDINKQFTNNKNLYNKTSSQVQINQNQNPSEQKSFKNLKFQNKIKNLSNKIDKINENEQKNMKKIVEGKKKVQTTNIKISTKQNQKYNANNEQNIKVKQKIKRRNGGQLNTENLKIQLDEKMLKIVKQNNKLLAAEVKEKKELGQLAKKAQNIQKCASNENAGSDESVQQSETDKSIKSVQTANINGRRARHNMTMHIIHNSKNRSKKRSYTIWDIYSQEEQDHVITTQSEKSDRQQTKKQKKPIKINQKEDKDDKKMKKKVQFKRTSIQGSSKKLLKKIGQIDKSNGKIKSMIQRINKEQSQMQIGQSLCEIGAKEEKSENKIYLNIRNDVKKSSKPKKIDIDNVYNELNYFRMRLNISKGPEEEIETGIKPHPQAIIFSIDRVMNQLQNQRIQRTKFTNQMIDIGVRLTKDRMLKQSPTQNKLIKLRI